MKRRYVFLISSICVILLVFGFLYGYNIADRIGKKPENIPSNEGIQGNTNNINNFEEDIPIIKTDDEYVTPNTTIEYIFYYLKCGHNVKKVSAASKDMVNLSKEKFISSINRNHPDWRVTKFSYKNIVIEIDKDQLCPNHYVIGVKDEKIAIYRIDSEGELVLESVLSDTSITMLKPIDQQKLRDGIIVDSKEEISRILENFIS